MKKETHENREIYTEYREFPGLGLGRVVLRYDDSCKNGHDTFSLTVDSRRQTVGAFGGCMHDEARKVFPELAGLIRWHLVSDDGPMHYIANTQYWAERGKLEHARRSAVAPNAELSQLASREWLESRLPELMTEFWADMAAIDWPGNGARETLAAELIA